MDGVALATFSWQNLHGVKTLVSWRKLSVLPVLKMSRLAKLFLSSERSYRETVPFPRPSHTTFFDCFIFQVKIDHLCRIWTLWQKGAIS